MTDGLEIVSPWLLVANVRVDAGVASRASEVFALAEWNVLSIRVLETLCETEINDVHAVLVGVIAADQEIVGLDISVDDALLVHLLDALDLQEQSRG